MTSHAWLAYEIAHPGATLEEIQAEPDWEAGHDHRVGFKAADGRRAGHVTGGPDDELADPKIVEEARRKFELLRGKVGKGERINFRDVVQGMTDFHLIHPERRAAGWRYVLECTEDDIKYGQEWPANIKRQQRMEKEDKKKAKKAKREEPSKGEARQIRSEEAEPSAKEKEEGLTEEQAAFIKELNAEAEHWANMKNNDGLGKSPVAIPREDLTIDQIDQYTPDHWFPRHKTLIRETGAHPMNAEPPHHEFWASGFVTPNYLHYVRNHGPVPFLIWEFHQVEIAHRGKTLCLSMEELQNKFSPINIPVVVACDGNRRREMNKIRTTKGVPFAGGAVSCSYWKGALLRDVLLAAGVPDPADPKSDLAGMRWINFEGSEDAAEGKYSTCISLEYAMDPTNDVMLAYEMNNLPLPPDHGFPVRLVIPGYVGGRWVKWLRRMWTSEKENDTYYHIYDNRLLPPFIKDVRDPRADALFHSPSSRLSEQILNSLIMRPNHGDIIPLHGGDQTIRVEGFAYNGGSCIDRVEISLDEGETWIYCFKRYPEAPMRHGRKFWTWVFWHVDIKVSDLVKHKTFLVRAWDEAKNTQPPKITWNVLGQMNNCWHRVVVEVLPADDEHEDIRLLFRHPATAGTPGPPIKGWMKDSVENQLEAARQNPDVGGLKRFTREEVEKHDTSDDCWIVVDGKVYDATSVMSWHPGGVGPIMAHAGIMHKETTDEFNSIHDSYAREKLNGKNQPTPPLKPP